MYFKAYKFVCFIFIHLTFSAHGYERKCVNLECSMPIAIVLTINNHSTSDIRYLQYSRDEYIVVYSYGNTTLSHWDGKISEGRLGFFDPNQTKILKTLHLEENLIEIDNFKLSRELPEFNISLLLNGEDKGGHNFIATNLTSEPSSQDSFLASRITGQESRRGPPPKDKQNDVDEKLQDYNSLIESKHLTSSQDKLSKESLKAISIKNSDNEIDSHNLSVPNQTSTTFYRGIKSFKPDDSLEENENSYGMSLDPIDEQKIVLEDTTSAEEEVNSDEKVKGEFSEDVVNLNQADDTDDKILEEDVVTSQIDYKSLEGQDKIITSDNFSNVNRSIEGEIKSNDFEDFKTTPNLTDSHLTETQTSQLPTANSYNYESSTPLLNTTSGLLDVNKSDENVKSYVDDNSKKTLNQIEDTQMPPFKVTNDEYSNNYSNSDAPIASNIEIPTLHQEAKNESNLRLNDKENINLEKNILEEAAKEESLGLEISNSSSLSQFDGEEDKVVMTTPTYTSYLNEPTITETNLLTPIEENSLHSGDMTTNQPFVPLDNIENIVENTTTDHTYDHTLDYSQDLVPESESNDFNEDDNNLDKDVNEVDKLPEVSYDAAHSDKSQLIDEELRRPESHEDRSHISSGDGNYVQKFNVCESKKAANGDIMHDPNCKKYMSDSLLFQDDTNNIDERDDTSSYMKLGLNKVFAVYDQLLFNLMEGVMSVNLLAFAEGVPQSNSCQGGPGCTNAVKRTLVQKIFRFRTFLIVLFTLFGTLSFYMGVRKNFHDNGSTETQEAIRQAYETNQKLDDMTILLNSYEKKIQDLESALTSKEDEVNELTADNSEYKDLKKRLENLETENEQLNDQCSRIPELESCKACLETEVEQYKVKITTLEEELVALRMAKENLEKTHASLEINHEKSLNEIEELKGDLEKSRGQLVQVSEKAKELEESLVDRTNAVDSYEILLKKLNVLKNSGFQNVRKRKPNSDLNENGIGKLDLEGEWGVDDSDTTSDILLETEDPIALDETTIKELMDSTHLFKQIEDLKAKNVELLEKIGKFEKDQTDIKTQAGKKDVEVNHYKNRCSNLENSNKELEGKLAFISKYFEDKECKLQRNINDLMNECDKYKKLNEELEKKLDLLKRQADLYLENLDESKKEFYECQKDMRQRINELEDASNKLKITAHGFERKANHLQCENQNLRQTLNELEQNMDTNSRLNSRPLLHGQMDNDSRDGAEANDKPPHSDDNSSSSHASKRHTKEVAGPKKGKAKLGMGGPLMPPFPFFPPLLPPPMVPPSGKHPTHGGHTSDAGGMGPLMMPPFFMNPPSVAQYGKGDREGNMTDSGLTKIKAGGVNLETGHPPVKKKSKKHGSKPNGHESDFSAASLSGISSVSATKNNNGAPAPFMMPPPPFAPFMMAPLPENFKGDASFSDFSQLASHSSPLQGDAGMIDSGQVKKKKVGHPNNKDRLV